MKKHIPKPYLLLEVDVARDHMKTVDSFSSRRAGMEALRTVRKVFAPHHVLIKLSAETLAASGPSGKCRSASSLLPE